MVMRSPGFEPGITAVGEILAKSEFGSSSSQNLNIKLLIVIVRVEYGGLLVGESCSQRLD